MTPDEQNIRDRALSIARPLRKDRDFEKIVSVIQDLLSKLEKVERGRDEMKEALITLLCSQNCYDLGKGCAEIPEEISANFDVTIAYAKRIASLTQSQVDTRKQHDSQATSANSAGVDA